MDIKQLSLIIDKKLAQLERQLNDLQQQQKNAADDIRIANDIAVLERLKQKMLKSRDLAWEAHKLQRESDIRLIQRKRWIGIGLCVFCLIGLAGLIAAEILL